MPSREGALDSLLLWLPDQPSSRITRGGSTRLARLARRAGSQVANSAATTRITLPARERRQVERTDFEECPAEQHRFGFPDRPVAPGLPGSSQIERTPG